MIKNYIIFVKKNLKILILIMCFLFIFFIVLFVYRRELIFKYEYNKLLKVPVNYNSDQLIRYNFADIDLTNIPLKESNYKMESFLKRISNNKFSILKVISYIENDIGLTLYFYDDRIDEIRAFTTLIEKNASYSPDRRFKSFNLVDKDNVRYIFLIGYYNPNFKDIKYSDELLYSYYIN